MAVAIYPGSFDPVTYGHLDIMKRACKLVDVLVIGVLTNKAKKPLFSQEERVEILKQVTKDLPNVRIETFSGLTVDFAAAKGADFVVRGLRAISDFDNELQMAQTNFRLNETVDTVFLPTSPEYAFLCSSTVKEIASFGGDVSKFVPPVVEKEMRKKFLN